MTSSQNPAAPTASKTLRIVNRLGLHARAAAKLVTLAAKYQADVQVEKDGRRVSGKSIMGVMMLAAAQGSRITVISTGTDALEAVEAIAALVADRFGEEA